MFCGRGCRLGLRPDLLYEHVYSPFLPPFNRTRFGAGTWAVVLNQTRALADGGAVEADLRAIPPLAVARMQMMIRVLQPRLQWSGHAAGVPNDAARVYLDVVEGRARWHEAKLALVARQISEVESIAGLNSTLRQLLQEQLLAA